VLFIAGLSFNQLGPSQWNWIKITFLIGSLLAVFIVATVPEHFLEEHLWKHIAKVHIPRVFLWTFGALLLMHVFIDYLALGSWIKASYLTVMVIACLIGLIPESGPHMIFVTLFAERAIPFGVLLASSVVQDGHGMPPLGRIKEGFYFCKDCKSCRRTIGRIGLLCGWVLDVDGVEQKHNMRITPLMRPVNLLRTA
jgi:hypothetical protein